MWVDLKITCDGLVLKVDGIDCPWFVFFKMSSFGSIVHNTVSNRGPSHDNITLALLRKGCTSDQLWCHHLVRDHLVFVSSFLIELSSLKMNDRSFMLLRKRRQIECQFCLGHSHIRLTSRVLSIDWSSLENFRVIRDVVERPFNGSRLKFSSFGRPSCKSRSYQRNSSFWSFSSLDFLLSHFRSVTG